MRRRVLVAALGSGALGVGVGARWCLALAQQLRPAAHIGILYVGASADFAGDPLWARLEASGLVEGRNLTIDRRAAEGDAARLPQLAAELAALHPDVLIAAGTEATPALMSTTRAIPIVMVLVRDPVGAGFVSSLAHPGGNVTGNSMLTTDLIGKRLELLKEVLPGERRVAVFADPSTHGDSLEPVEAAARVLGIAIETLAVAADDAEPGFAAARQAGADAVLISASPFYAAHRARLAELAIRYRLPTVHDLRRFVTAGGLMSYGPDRRALLRRAADYVVKILDGAKPADLPVEQPTKFELVINLKTAKALGLTIPPALLARADEIIE